MKIASSLAALACLLLATAPSFADSPEAQKQEGRERFGRGIELFRDGNYRAALIEFTRAYDVAPSYKIQFNIGQTCMELQDYPCALRAFTTYLHDGGEDVPKEREESVSKDLARLHDLIATVTITVNQPGAEVALDDVSIGRSPLAEPVPVGAGRHKITVTLAPSPPVTRVIDVAGGDHPEVAIDLAPPSAEPPPPPIVAAAPPPAPAVEPAPSPSPTTSRAPFWIALASTGAFGVGAAVTGSLSLASKSSLDNTAATLGTTASQLHSSQNSLRALTITTDCLLGATVVAGALTTVFYFSTKPSKKTVGHVDVGPGWVGVSGTF